MLTILVAAAILLVSAAAALGYDLLRADGAGPAQDKPASSQPVAVSLAEADPPAPIDVGQESTPAPTPEPLPSATPTEAQAGEEVPPACIPPDDWTIYVVQPGNNLYSLGERFGTDVETLMRINCLNTTTIFIDQRLYVPGPVMAMATPTPFPTVSLTGTALAGASELAGESAPANAAPAAATRVPGALNVNIPERNLNIVLLGSDKRPNSGAWRTDSMIVVSVDLESELVRLLSIPRDLWVYIPGHGYNRINTADLWGELAQKGGGPERVKRTIYYNLGIPIHYYMRVDFKGFMKIIDTVGGVDIDVECPLPDIQLTAGMHHMSGQEALRYSRSRYSTNDFDRGRRQRKVLMALWEQALTLDLIPKIPTLWKQLSANYQTDLPLSQVINLAYVGARLKPQRILNRAIGSGQVQSWITPEGAAVLLPQPEKIRALLESYYNNVAAQSLDTAEKVRVQVLNGSQRKDAQELAAAALRWGGFQVTGTGVAPNTNQSASQILCYSGNLEAAGDAAAMLGLSPAAIQDMTNTESPPGAAPTADIQIILGRDYDACRR
ncbi:MAG TPA: LCP family protein [Anaerolineae bacterium]|nr:LCP family protein [Anaerolineae bacterium]